MTGRFCDDNFEIKYRSLRFLTTQIHINARQLPTIVTLRVMMEIDVAPNLLVGMSRDSVAINGVAFRMFQMGTFFSSVDLVCVATLLILFSVTCSWLDVLR